MHLTLISIASRRLTNQTAIGRSLYMLSVMVTQYYVTPPTGMPLFFCIQGSINIIHTLIILPLFYNIIIVILLLAII